MKKLLLLSLVLIFFNSCCEAFFVLEQCDKAESIKDNELKKLLEAPTIITLNGKSNYLFSTFILPYECKCKCSTVSFYFRKYNQLIPKKFWIINTKTKKAWSKDVSLMSVVKEVENGYTDNTDYRYYKIPLELVNNTYYQDEFQNSTKIKNEIEVVAEVKDINNNKYLIKKSDTTVITTQKLEEIAFER